MVTVAIPTYNGAKLIEDAVKSINQQAGFVNKVLIIDDCSTDDTIAVAERLKNKYNLLEIEIYRNDLNLGYQSNWNNCFDYCKTRYLVILHQDDMLHENTIEDQLNAFTKYPNIAIVGGQEDKVDLTGNKVSKKMAMEDLYFQKGNIYEFMLKQGSYIPCSSVMLEMDKIRSIGYFETEFLAADEFFWPKVLSRHPLLILGKSLIKRRSHPNQAEWADFKNRRDEVYAALVHFNDIIDLEERTQEKRKLKKLIKKKIGKSLCSIGGAVIRHYGTTNLSIWYLARAIKTYPLVPFKEVAFWKSFIMTILSGIGFYNMASKTRKKLIKA